MTALEVVETGELVEPMTSEQASSITTQITVKLDAIADNYESVMPLIRDAITRQAHLALGYASPGAYIADRFGSALSRLGVEMRREVERELSAAGLSTRAIAPVVGVSDRQVRHDVSSGGKSLPTSPEPEPNAHDLDADGRGECEPDEPDGFADRIAAELAASDERYHQLAADLPTPEPEPITGLDGKKYTQKSKRKKPNRKSLPDAATKAAWDIRKATERIERIVCDDRYAANEKQVADALRGHLLYVAETVAAVIDQLPNQQGV